MTERVTQNMNRQVQEIGDGLKEVSAQLEHLMGESLNAANMSTEIFTGIRSSSRKHRNKDAENPFEGRRAERIVTSRVIGKVKTTESDDSDEEGSDLEDKTNGARHGTEIHNSNSESSSSSSEAENSSSSSDEGSDEVPERKGSKVSPNNEASKVGLGERREETHKSDDEGSDEELKSGSNEKTGGTEIVTGQRQSPLIFTNLPTVKTNDPVEQQSWIRRRQAGAPKPRRSQLLVLGLLGTVLTTVLIVYGYRYFNPSLRTFPQG
jgi:cobalamin biosynthesis Mg chelatase CobN